MIYIHGGCNPHRCEFIGGCRCWMIRMGSLWIGGTSGSGPNSTHHLWVHCSPDFGNPGPPKMWGHPFNSSVSLLVSRESTCRVGIGWKGKFSRNMPKMLEIPIEANIFRTPKRNFPAPSTVDFPFQSSL